MAGADHRSPRSRGVLISLLVIGVLAFAGFAALGAWQVQRLGWKLDLIARVDQRLRAEPVDAPAPPAWPGIGKAADEYRRVRVHGRFAHELETLVQASTELGAGYWVMTPLFTDQGYWVLVNRGFVPPEQRERAGHDLPAGELPVSGLLRLSEPGGSLLQHNQPAAGRWYSRDVQAMAQAHALGGAQRPGPVAPYFIDAAADPAAPAAWPRAGLTVVHFSNNHLVYAMTWFALAAMVAAAVVYLLVEERRLRR